MRHASAYDDSSVPTITAKPADRLPSYDEVPANPAADDASSIGGDIQPPGHAHQPMPAWMQRCTPVFLHGVDALLLLTVLGAVVGIAMGSLLRLANLSPMAIELLGAAACGIVTLPHPVYDRVSRGDYAAPPQAAGAAPHRV